MELALSLPDFPEPLLIEAVWIGSLFSRLLLFAGAVGSKGRLSAGWTPSLPGVPDVDGCGVLAAFPPNGTSSAVGAAVDAGATFSTRAGAGAFAGAGRVILGFCGF